MRIVNIIALLLQAIIIIANYPSSNSLNQHNKGENEDHQGENKDHQNLIGGVCEEDSTLSYLFDAVYGIGCLTMVVFVIEKCLGFGRLDA